MELVASRNSLVHAIRTTAKYWTLCGQVASVRRRWHTEAQEFENHPSACVPCRAALDALSGRGVVQDAVR